MQTDWPNKPLYQIGDLIIKIELPNYKQNKPDIKYLMISDIKRYYKGFMRNDYSYFAFPVNEQDKKVEEFSERDLHDGIKNKTIRVQKVKKS